MGIFRKAPPLHPTADMLKAIARFRDNEARGERPDLDGAVYHGACLGCVYMRGNDMRSGIAWCLGCKFSTFNQSLPDLSCQLPPADRSR